MSFKFHFYELSTEGLFVVKKSKVKQVLTFSIISLFKY